MPFTVGSTAFGLFDSDTQFQSDADKILEYVRRNIGDPVLDIQMSASMVYQAFEQATMEYSSIINQYQAKSALVTFLGSSALSTSGSENTYPIRNLEFVKKMAEPYGEEAGVGGSTPWFSGSIALQAGQQKYDLQALLSGSGALTGSNANTRIQVRKLLHFSPVSAYRFFGTNSTLNYLNNEFHFESYTPETIFYLLPIWEDILRGMQFETSNRVRRSQYSYEIHNNVLTLYPTPTDSLDLWVEYTLPGNLTNDGANKVSNLSNVPFGFINYSGINSVGKTWIWRMALAFSKEMEGLLRRKASSIPIPNGDLTLDGDAMVSDGKGEQDALRTELRSILDELTYDKLQARQMEMSDAIERQLAKVPLGIYVGAWLLVMLNPYN
jgi:hypothetical protein